MAAYEGSERYYEETADRITDGAEQELVAKLTGEALDMMEKAVTNPDRYQVLARLVPQALMGILAENRTHIEADVADAVITALKREDDALQTILAAQKAGAAASATDYAQIYAAQAAKGVTEILQRQNVALVDELAKLWYQVAGNAVTRTILGDSKRDIMEDAVRALSDGGLETIDYKSHHRTSIDAATRRHIVTQANQARNRLLTQRCSQYDCDLVFTSAHYGARPDHALWQGKAYGLHGPVTQDGVKYPGLVASTGYGTVTGLAGANCRHTMTPYVPGLSKLPRTDFSEEEKLFGKTSDEYYEATQVQRRLERNVRKYKRRIALGQEQGLDMTGDRARLGQAQKRVNAWCKQNKLPRQYEREKAYGVVKQPRALGPKKTVAKGALTGALNEHNDPSGSRREEHAKRYYEELRNRDRHSLVHAMSTSSGLPEEDVERAFTHVFINEHYLVDPNNPSQRRMQRFDPDYKMSQAWQRLCSGKGIYPSDVVLLQHEAAEAILMESGMLYEEAHKMVCKMGYDYEKALREDQKRRGSK